MSSNLNSQFKLEPLATVHNTSNLLFKVSVDGCMRLLKRYQGSEAQLHRDAEDDRLRYWRNKGLRVPDVVEIEMASETQPYLVIEWLEGKSLSELLRADMSADAKFKYIQRVVQDFRERHQSILKSEDIKLIHYDPNTGNILLSNNLLYYIDFELDVVAKGRSIAELLAIELAKLIRWSAKDMGNKHLPEIAQLTVDIYGLDNPIIRALIARVYKTPLQFFERFKDRRKKTRMPDDVTKYDIADELARVVERSTL